MTTTVTTDPDVTGTFSPSGEAITGGTIDNTPIGGTTPSTVKGTTITATTKILNANGTAGAPSYSFTSQPASGLFVSVDSGSPAIGVTLLGTERFRFDASPALYGLTLSPTSAVQWNSAAFSGDSAIDTTLTRVSAALLQIGTTTSNALGSLNLVNLTGSGYVKTGSFTVATLPAAATAGAGAHAYVTDASTTLVLGLGGPITGGGANKTPAWCDATNWNYG